jgi:hypothetical protein
LLKGRAKNLALPPRTKATTFSAASKEKQATVNKQWQKTDPCGMKNKWQQHEQCRQIARCGNQRGVLLKMFD